MGDVNSSVQSDPSSVAVEELLVLPHIIHKSWIRRRDCLEGKDIGRTLFRVRLKYVKLANQFISPMAEMTIMVRPTPVPLATVKL